MFSSVIHVVLADFVPLTYFRFNQVAHAFARQCSAKQRLCIPV